MNKRPYAFTRLYAADWARKEGKRVCARVDVPTRTIGFVRDTRLTLDSLLTLVRKESASERSLISFDLAIGIPAELPFADSEPKNSFLDWLKHHARNESFWQETNDYTKWSTSRPFISVPPGKGSLTKFRDRACCDLRRSFDRAFQGKSPLIVNGIPGTVGSGTRSFWRELVGFLDSERDFGIWPFECSLEISDEQPSITVCENYPAISYTVVFAKSLPCPRLRISKTKQEVRSQAISLLDSLEWLRRWKVKLPNLTVCIESEDHFDALMVGLAKLRCILEAPELLSKIREKRTLEGDIICSGAIDESAKSIGLMRYRGA